MIIMVIIVRHRWFKTIDWEEVYCRQLKPPIVPKVSFHQPKHLCTKIVAQNASPSKACFFSVGIFIWQAFPLAQVRYEGDTKNFDDYPETDWASVKKVSERQLAMFEDFWAGAINFFWEQDQRRAWSVIYSLTTSLFNSTNIWWL